ncbi:MAG: hypothetical protein JOZ82_02090 [Marmoricola sp.]|nr:hypothetical protein [Marmoricola sp.]
MVTLTDSPVTVRANRDQRRDNLASSRHTTMSATTHEMQINVSTPT